MKSIYHAYQAYEGRGIRGELGNTPHKALKRSVPRESLLVHFGDLLINAGLKLKWHHVTRKSTGWSAGTGVKP